MQGGGKKKTNKRGKGRKPQGRMQSRKGGGQTKREKNTNAPPEGKKQRASRQQGNG